AAEKNSTLVMPFPVEMLRFFDRAAGGGARAEAAPPNLAERLARAEEDLSKANEPSSIDSAKDVPPVPSLPADEASVPADEAGRPGIEAPHRSDGARNP